MKNDTHTKKHNGIISFWKFCFCMMIVIYHAYVFSDNPNDVLLSKGSIAVEFFFLVSGYLLAKTALKKSKAEEDSNHSIGKDTIKFMWKKWTTFIPYTLLAGLISLTIINIYEGFSAWNNVTFIWDVGLIGISGFKGVSVNGPSWYLHSMLLSMLILYPVLKKYKYNFIYIIAPIIIILGFGYLNSQYNNLRVPGQFILFTSKGNIRAFLEMLLGSVIFVICEKMQKVNFTKLGQLLLTIIELICFITPFMVSQFVVGATKYDFVVLLIISIGVLIAFSEKTLEYNWSCNKVFYWLEKWSLTLYLFHFPVRLFIRNASYFKNFDYQTNLLYYLFGTLILSIVVMYLLDYLKKRHFYINKIKKIIIVT